MTTGPNYQQGPVVGQQADARKQITDIIRSDTSVYFKAFAMDPQNFAAAAATEFDAMKKMYDLDPNKSNFEWLVEAVRKKGWSKGTGPTTLVSADDYAGIAKAFKGGYLNGTDYIDYMKKELSTGGSGTGAPTFSKDITTALQLLDASDSASKLNEAYFKAFNKMPSQNLIKSFMNKFNAEAKAQLATTTTTTTTAGSGTTKSSSKRGSVVSGEGFTAEEQNQFLAQFLKDNFKITGQEQAGQAITIINALKKVHEDNLLPQPSMEELSAIAADVVGTADVDMAKQKIDSYAQGVRKTAAKFYPSMADSLAEGQDIRTYIGPAVQAVNAYLDTNWDLTEPRIKEIINQSDGKGGFRSMNATELENWALKQAEAQTSSYGRNKAMELAQAFKEGLK